jgi:hypothetical protein
MSPIARHAVLVALSITTLVFPLRCAGFEGRVIDGATGEPVADVFVIGRWETGGGFVISSPGCALAVVKSNAKGEFTLVGEDGFLGRLLGPTSRPAIEFYQRGYVRESRAQHDDSTMTIVHDPRPAHERIQALLKIESFADCGMREGRRRTVEPLYRAIYEEVRDLARTKDDLGYLNSAMFNLDLLDLDLSAALERARQRHREWGLK